MRTIAILPVKRFPAAKQRLRPGLDPPQRASLAEAMFRDVLTALSQAPLDGTVVVTRSPQARSIAIAHGAKVVRDSETGHSAAAELGIRAAIAQGAQRALLVPGDCPALDPEDVRELLSYPISAPSVLIVPDRHGTGTNALLITPPSALAPSFGPGSCQRHLDVAHASGLPAAIVEVPSLALDIDTPEDLELLSTTLEPVGSIRQLLRTC